MRFLNIFSMLAMAGCLNLGMVGEVSAQHDGVGSGTRGGGEVIDVDSTPYLRDLVTRSVCEWKKGGELLDGNKVLQGTLTKLTRLDWFFAADLRMEIMDLNFCLTGPLYKWSEREWAGAVRAPRNERTRQAGYRFNREIYLDSEIYSAMNDDNKAMLLVHETLHSYLSMETFDRALKLRSMVKILDKVRTGEVVTRGQLHYAMEMNEVIFPRVVAILEKNKEAVLFLISPLADKVELLKKSPSPESLVDVGGEQLLALTQAYGRMLPHESLSGALLAALQSSTPAEVLVLLDQKEWKRVNPSQVALSAFYSFDLDQRAALLESKSFAWLITNGFDGLVNASVGYRDFLIQASPELQEVTQERSWYDVPLVDLVPVVELPSSLRWVTETLAFLEASGKADRMLKNEAFYRALGLKSQKAVVSKMEIRIKRERKVALQRLNDLSEALVKALLVDLERRMEAQSFKEILKKIDFKAFENEGSIQ